jgi:ABC-type lipoprotein export system ATPase subunit
MEIMAELSQRHGTTFVLATHSSEAASYANRKMLMRDGSLSSEKEST